MGNNKMSPRIFTRNRVAALVVVILVVAAGATFAVRTRSDLGRARDSLEVSQQNLGQLDVLEHGAVGARTQALAALQRARDALAADTASRDRLRATDRVEFARLSAALKTLSQHQLDLAASQTRAKLLDDCLIGASQVLNEAAVGDIVHLRTTLPAVQQLCTQAAA